VSSQSTAPKLPGQQPASVAAAGTLARQRERAPAGREERLEAERAVLAQQYPPAQRPLSWRTARPSTWWRERLEQARAQPPER
jgi:hypothetical protein